MARQTLRLPERSSSLGVSARRAPVLGALVIAFVLAASCVVRVALAASIFVSDGENGGGGLIRQYDLQGNEVGSIRNPAFSLPTFVVVDPSTSTLITDINFTGPDGPDICKLDLQGNILARNSTGVMFGARGGGITDVIPSGHGSYFVISTLNVEIAEVDQNLQLLRRFPSGAIQGGLRVVGGTLSPDGTRLLVADAGGPEGQGLIRVYDARTGAQLGPITHPALRSPFYLEFDRRGHVYVIDRGATEEGVYQDRVIAFDESFTVGTPIFASAPHYIFGPLAILPGGNLAVLETDVPVSAPPIHVLSPDGQQLFGFGVGAEFPDGIAVLPGGPDCSQATAIPSEIDRPDHELVPIRIGGVTDSDGDPVTISVTGITQDETLDARGDGSTCPDATIVDGAARVRAERSGTGNGRVYRISFIARDARGGSCDGSVSVCVPHDHGHGACVDDGQSFNSLGPCPGNQDRDPGVVSRLTRARATLTGHTMTIEYSLRAASDVSVAVFDIAGRRVTTIEHGPRDIGTHQANWNTAAVARGTYFYRIQAGPEAVTRSVLILK